MRRGDRNVLRSLVVSLGLILGAAAPARAGQNASASAEYARAVSSAGLRLVELEKQLLDGQRRIEQLEEVIRAQGQSEASRLENIDQVNAELTRLRGQFEVFSFTLDEVKSTVQDAQIAGERRSLHHEKRLAAVEGFLGLKAPPPPTDDELGISPTGGPSVGPTLTEPAQEEAVPPTVLEKLDAAIAHMEAGRQGAARAVLQRAISDHPGAKEMAEVRYRYAETLLNEEKLRPAILEFKKVTDGFPDSEWSCWAYYRQGEAMEALSGVETARVFYSGATQNACKSSEAGKLAKKKL